MRNLANFTVEFEYGETGMLYNTENIERFKLSNSNAYPVTEHIVESYKKALSKEILKFVKKGFGHNMMTVHGWERGYYENVNLCRFTIEVYNGKTEVQYREYTEHEGFPITVVKTFDNNTKAKNYILNIVESYIFENIKVKQNSENYFTKNV